MTHPEGLLPCSQVDKGAATPASYTPYELRLIADPRLRGRHVSAHEEADRLLTELEALESGVGIFWRWMGTLLPEAEGEPEPEPEEGAEESLGGLWGPLTAPEPEPEQEPQPEPQPEPEPEAWPAAVDQLCGAETVARAEAALDRALAERGPQIQRLHALWAEAEGGGGGVSQPEREAVERSVRAELPSLGALLEAALAEQSAGGAPFAERGGDAAAAEAEPGVGAERRRYVPPAAAVSPKRKPRPGASPHDQDSRPTAAERNATATAEMAATLAAAEAARAGGEARLARVRGEHLGRLRGEWEAFVQARPGCGLRLREPL